MGISSSRRDGSVRDHQICQTGIGAGRRSRSVASEKNRKLKAQIHRQDDATFLDLVQPLSCALLSRSSRESVLDQQNFKIEIQIFENVSAGAAKTSAAWRHSIRSRNSSC